MKFEARPNLRWTVELFAHTRPASSRVQKLNVASGNLDILLGIGRLGSISWKYDIVMGYCRKKKRSFTILRECHRKSREDLLNFREVLKLHIVFFKIYVFSVLLNIIQRFLILQTYLGRNFCLLLCKHYKIRKLNINI